MKSYDCAVVGGGPAGMTAVLYLCRSGAKVAWVEKLSPGGQMLMTEEVENFPGFPNGAKGYELADLMAAQLGHYQYDHYMDGVSAMEHTPGKNILTFGDEQIEAKSVVICTGAQYRKLGLEREKELTGRGVSYCALCDGNFYRDQVVVVVGGGNTALEESLYLTKLVKKLYLIHRRDKFRGDKIYQDKVLNHSKIEVLFDTVVDDILGDQEVAGLTVTNLKTKEARTLDATGLFVFIGYDPSGGFFPDELDKDPVGFLITDCEMRTNLPGVFAAGDIRSKLCRQVATAVGDGATAANSAFLYLEQMHA